MFSKDELVIYGSTGVCRITDIKKGIAADDEERLYYVLKPVYEECVIYAPVDGKVFMRRVITKEEALSLIDSISDKEAPAYYNTRTQELAGHYQSLINTHECEDLFKLTMSIYDKKQAADRQNRKLGQVDERFMRHAEALLYGELSVALGIPKESVQDFIEKRVSEKTG